MMRENLSRTASHAEMHLSYSLRNAPVREFPFPHCYIRDVFPSNYYELIQQNLPDHADMISNGQAGRGAQLTARFVLELKSQYLQTLPEGKREFWSEFAHWILAEPFKTSALGKFAELIERRFMAAGDVEFNSDAVLVEDLTNHSMGPHTDHPRKALAMLFYLPKDDSQAHLGTSIYLPKDPAFVCPGSGPHHRSDGFELVTTIPYLPNSLFMFAKTDNSFHGVEPVDDLDCRRWLLMFNVIARTQQDENRRL
jgi:hypothetical protein